MTALGSANDGLRFLIEVSALVALGYWGFKTGGTATQWILGLGAPLLAAVVWGRFIAPNAAHPVADPGRLLLEVVIFGAATVALAAADRPRLAAALGAIAAVHLTLTFALDQRSFGRSASGRWTGTR